MDNLLTFAVQTDVFSCLSAVMAYWLWVITWGTGCFVVQHKYRYLNWFKINVTEKADACLNLGSFFFFGYAALQRTLSTYDLALVNWKLTTITSVIAPIYMPIGLVGISLWLWWLCFHKHQPNYRRWWCNYMWTGMALFVIMIYLF